MNKEACIESYGRLKNLKLVGDELGVKWQKVYATLKREGVPVVGDKARYGSATDRLAAHAERLFAMAVPEAKDANQEQFQAAIDFDVYGWKVDIKASTLRKRKHPTTKKETTPGWAFCINKQKDKADFFVFYALDNAEDRNVVHVILLPRELATTTSSLLLPETMNSKWADYRIDESELAEFFLALKG